MFLLFQLFHGTAGSEAVCSANGGAVVARPLRGQINLSLDTPVTLPRVRPFRIQYLAVIVSATAIPTPPGHPQGTTSVAYNFPYRILPVLPSCLDPYGALYLRVWCFWRKLSPSIMFTTLFISRHASQINPSFAFIQVHILRWFHV